MCERSFAKQPCVNTNGHLCRLVCAHCDHNLPLQLALMCICRAEHTK